MKGKERESSVTTMLLQKLTDSLKESIVVVNGEGVVQYNNRSFSETFGEPQWHHSKLSDFLPPTAIELIKARTNESDPYHETYLTTKTGKSIVAKVTATTLNSKHGTLLAVYIRDFSLEKNFENELIAAKEAAIKASEVKSDFLANMSHEVRTPLNGVIGMTTLLEDTPLNSQQKEYVHALRLSGETLLTVVNDILDLSKVESGKINLENIPFSIRELISTCYTTFYYVAKSKGVRLIQIVEKNLPSHFLGDPARITQILNNLVNNAIKFTQEGSVTIKASGEVINDSRCSLTIDVIDTGIGIPPETQERMFEAFEQEDTSTTRKYGGTGLGLSICRKLSDLMNGKIEIVNNNTKGSTFRFTIELAVAEQKRLAKDFQIPSISRIKGLRILVAEDSLVNQKIVQSILEKRGLKSVCVSSGDEVLDSLRDMPFDAILMDQKMPGKNGVETTKIIRKSRTLGQSSIPIIALTGSTGPKDKEELMKAGVDACLNKPVNEKLLLECLLEIIPVKKAA